MSDYLFILIKSTQFQLSKDIVAGDGIMGSIKNSAIESIQIPLPPLEVQEQIVAEIEGYQRIIDGARMVVDNYKPTISIKPHWEMVELTEILSNEKYSIKAGPFGSSLKKSCC